MLDKLFVMDETAELKNRYHIKRAIITHLEEDWENPMMIILICKSNSME